MGKPTGFMEIPRELPTRRPVSQRVQDFLEVYNPFPEDKLRAQGARCMDCGVPFCHQGCPLGNLIPDWNDLVYRNQWRAAIERLHLTNNFPEFTGKLCPAPCEASCVLGINSDPVAIKQVEASIIERAWNEGWVVPQPPKITTGKKVAIVGSGPAGLAAAQQLARAGHAVTVFERDDRIGGLLRYGIPDFKMEKRHLDRRLQQMEAEGVVFRPKVNVGLDINAQQLLDEFDAICLCGGSTQPRDLPIEGRELDGIHFAMQFLTAQNRRVAGLPIDDSRSSRLAANMSSSSAVATPARIVLALSIDKSARAFINLKSCHDLTKPGNRRILGLSGRTFFASRRPTRKAVFASTRSTPRGSWASTARSANSRPSGSR